MRSYAKRSEASVTEGAICICQRHFKTLCEIEDAQAAPTRLEIGGEHLGEVGGRIVGEVLLGLLEADPSSYKAEPGWWPVLPGAQSGKFTIANLLRFAEAA